VKIFFLKASSFIPLLLYVVNNFNLMRKRSKCLDF
jgi:hypothetical protein